MAGMIFNGARIDFFDATGSATVNGRTYYWEFYEWTGPVFTRKDGQPLAQYPSETHPVWPAFVTWLQDYEQKQRNQRALDIVYL